MIADRLKTLRQRKSLSQMALSKILGISQQTVGSWETGRTSPDIGMITTIAKKFNISTDYLLGLSDVENVYVERTLGFGSTLAAIAQGIDVRNNDNSTVNIGNNATINATVTTGTPPAPDRECLDILENFFGHSPEAMELIKHIKVTNGKLDIPKDKAEFLRYVKDNMIAAFNQALKEGHPEQIEVPLPQQG